jgi:CDP-6-deoxy-D-xylo-4-hexulose-3-dehydrase
MSPKSGKLLSLTHSTWGTEEIQAMNRVIHSGNFTMGEEVKKFEEEFAAYIGTRFAVMVNSGSSANLALLFALKYMKSTTLIENCEIIVPTVSWSTTFYPVSQAGFKLRFVDIDLSTLNIDARQIESNINEKTRAIFAVNLLGNPCNYSEIARIAKKYDLILIEDNCESLGATFSTRLTGSLGLAGTHSFFYSHHICTMEGGMVTTDSEELAENLRSVRAHGWTRGLPQKNYVHNLSQNHWEDLYRFVLPGFNLRPVELTGAIGQEQLKKLPKFLESRRKNAKVFQKLLNDSEHFLIQREEGSSSWFGFSIVLREHLQGKRSNFLSVLQSEGVETRPIVAGNFLRNPVIQHLNHVKQGDYDNANYIHENGFFIGNHQLDLELALQETVNILNKTAKELAG